MDREIKPRDIAVGIDVQNGDEKRPIFYGHVAGGSAFIVAGIFWMVLFSMKRNSKHGGESKSKGQTGSRGFMKVLQQIPWEGVYWVSVGSFTLLQICRVPYFHFRLTDDDGEISVDSMQGWQHVAITVPFTVHGVTRIIARAYGSTWASCVEPTGIVACGMFSLITFLHIYGRDPLDAHVHTILAAAALSTTLFYVAEYFSTTKTIKTKLCLPKTFSMFLQGTWMCQGGFILDPPDGTEWQRDNPVSIMFVSTTFVGHIIFDMAILLVVHLLVQTVLWFGEYPDDAYGEVSVDKEEDTMPLMES